MTSKNNRKAKEKEREREGRSLPPRVNSENNIYKATEEKFPAPKLPKTQ